MMKVEDLPTPSVLVQSAALEANLTGMQAACDAAGIGLRPHIKTHKLVPVARRQLELGAKGLTCAKLGEAETMLASGVKELFLAHSLVDVRQTARIATLAEQLDELRLAVTSEAHLEVFQMLVRKVGRSFPVMLAIDTGLNREGTRQDNSAHRLAAAIAADPRLELAGIYSHEGQFYRADHRQRTADVAQMLDHLCGLRDAIDPALEVWPGCSVSALAVIEAGAGRVQAVRPGAYVFGDLSLTTNANVMPWEHVALHVLATVIDKPTPELALIDAGSKTFSSDQTADGITAVPVDGRRLEVFRVNEEHGYLRGADLESVRVGDRIAFVPAHVCPVVNLTDQIQVVGPHDNIAATWPVDARGRNQ